MCFGTEHRIGLGLSWAGGPAKATGVWVLDHAIRLAENSVGAANDPADVEADIAAAKPLLTAKLDDSFVTIPSDQLAALERILDDAQQYWTDNGYDHDEGDDGILGRLAYQGYVTKFADCWNR